MLKSRNILETNSPKMKTINKTISHYFNAYPLQMPAEIMKGIKKIQNKNI